jgi:hypothetical protein
MDGDDKAFGVSHLSNLPITLTFGMVLLVVLLVLILLRVVFGEISISGGAKV